jgi:hypothetical protein
MLYETHVDDPGVAPWTTRALLATWALATLLVMLAMNLVAWAALVTARDEVRIDLHLARDAQILIS